VREDLPDHGGIVQRGDQAQPAPAGRARQDINGKRPVHRVQADGGGLHSGTVQPAASGAAAAVGSGSTRPDATTRSRHKTDEIK
jgi:hypothetical protein